LDDFYFNQQGELDERVENDRPDRFFAESGKQVTGTIEEGTIKVESTYSEIDINGDLGQMARTVYAESAGQNDESKLAVAEVIRNRSNDKTENSADKGWAAIFDKANTYTEVVQQKGQFESVQKGASRYADPSSVTKNSDGIRNEIETKSLTSSVGAAIKAHYQNTNTAKGAAYFYSPYIKAPAWTGKL